MWYGIQPAAKQLYVNTAALRYPMIMYLDQPNGFLDKFKGRGGGENKPLRKQDVKNGKCATVDVAPLFHDL